MYISLSHEEHTFLEQLLLLSSLTITFRMHTWPHAPRRINYVGLHGYSAEHGNTLLEWVESSIELIKKAAS